MGTGKNLTVNFHTQTLKPIAWIHTHPDTWGGYGQSGGDTQTTRTLGVPSIILGRHYVYAQSVRLATKYFEGPKVMTIQELRTGTISIKDNIRLLK